MANEQGQGQRRKRVSDGGLGNRESEATPVRILPEADGGNGSTPVASGDVEGEWVLEFGGNAAQDDPTTRLPQDGDAERNLRPGTLYTHATTPYPLPNPRHTLPPPSQQQAQPAQAIYNQPQLQAPPIQQPSADRSLIERPVEREAKQPVTIIKQGPTTCAILSATFGVIAIACALLTFATIRDGFSGLGNLFGWVPNIFGPPTVSIDTSRPSIIEKVSALSRLETVHYEVEKVVEGRSVGFLGDDKILLIGHGSVIAGVDLSKLKPGDIKVFTDTGSVTIRLPKAEVFNLNNILDNNETRVYDRSRPNPLYVDSNLETQIRNKAAEEILQAALEGGILAKAQNNAQDVIRSLVTGLGYTDVKFESGP